MRIRSETSLRSVFRMSRVSEEAHGDELFPNSRGGVRLPILEPSNVFSSAELNGVPVRYFESDHIELDPVIGALGTAKT